MTSNSSSSSAPRILLIRLSSLGDIILTTPLIVSLRERFPESAIDLVISSEYESLVTLLPGVTKVHLYDKQTGIRGLHHLRSNLREQNYDVVLDLHNSLRTRLLRRSISKRLSVIDKRTMKRWMLVKYKYDALGVEPDVIGRYYETARSLGVSDQGRTPTLAVKAARELKRVAIAPGARHWNKRWPVEYFVEVAKQLHATGWVIDLLGAKHDRELAQEIATALPAGAADNLAGKLTITETAQRMARAAIAITNDSGLMHVAQAVGTRTISLFGPTVRQFGFTPRAADAVVLEVEGLYCRPCTAIGLPNCPQRHFRCMHEIRPEQVLTQIDREYSS